MARPGELAQAISEVFDIELATVRQQARMLRNAGFMAKEKAGRGSGTMGARDAANLLLAVGGTARVKYSTYPVEQNGATTTEGGPWNLAFLPVPMPELSDLPSDHTLADALEALILMATANRIDLRTGELRTPALGTMSGIRLGVRLEMNEPLPWSELAIGLYCYDEDHVPTLEPVERKSYRSRPGTGGQFMDPPFIASSLGDLKHKHIFTERAIFEVAKTMVGESDGLSAGNEYNGRRRI